MHTRLASAKTTLLLTAGALLLASTKGIGETAW